MNPSINRQLLVHPNISTSVEPFLPLSHRGQFDLFNGFRDPSLQPLTDDNPEDRYVLLKPERIVSAMSINNWMLAVAYTDGSAQLYDATTLKMVGEIQFDTQGIDSIKPIGHRFYFIVRNRLYLTTLCQFGRSVQIICRNDVIGIIEQKSPGQLNFIVDKKGLVYKPINPYRLEIFNQSQIILNPLDFELGPLTTIINLSEINSQNSANQLKANIALAHLNNKCAIVITNETGNSNCWEEVILTENPLSKVEVKTYKRWLFYNIREYNLTVTKDFIFIKPLNNLETNPFKVEILSGRIIHFIIKNGAIICATHNRQIEIFRTSDFKKIYHLVLPFHVTGIQILNRALIVAGRHGTLYSKTLTRRQEICNTCLSLYTPFKVDDLEVEKTVIKICFHFFPNTETKQTL